MPSSPTTSTTSKLDDAVDTIVLLPSPKNLKLNRTYRKQNSDGINDNNNKNGDDNNNNDDGLTDDLLAHTTSLALNPKNKDKIIQLYLDADKEERRIITKMYSHAFEDPQFVQCLIRAGTLRVVQTVEKEFDPSNNNNNNNNTKLNNNQHQKNNVGGGGGSYSNLSSSMNKVIVSMKSKEADSIQVNKESGQRRPRGEEEDENEMTKSTDNGGGGSAVNNNAEQPEKNQRTSGTTSKEDLQARCRTLRKEIDEAVCAVTGPGPHKIRFGVARTQNEIDKLVNLYNQQFVYPGLRELQKTYVKLPQKVSTRHRSIKTGNFCWYIQYVNTGEICCAATVNILPVNEGREDRVVFEIPLYATAAGFKRLGLARLLNAAIQELSIFMKADLILISSDQNAVPFWTNKNLGGGGYSTLTRGQKDSYQFLYENQCQLFGDTTMVCWCPPRGADALASGLLQDALDKNPKFVLDGPARLPLV